MTKLIDDPERLATDPEYRDLRDNPHRAEVRAKVEALWTAFEPYADPHFRVEARAQFLPRFWEMYFGYGMAQQGFSRDGYSKGRGPDFCFRSPAGQRVWVEAVASMPGDGPDRLTYRGGFVPADQVLLRMRASIEEKVRKRQRYVDTGDVGAKEAFVIAINCAALGRPPVPLLEADPPWILQAVFPIGTPYVEVPIEPDCQEEPLQERYSSRYTLTKRSGSTVSTDIFLNPEYAGISAVIYSATDHFSIPARHGQEFRVVHNPEATQRLSRPFLSIGTEYWRQGDQIHGSTRSA